MALAGASQVVRALRGLGHEVTVIDTVAGPVAGAAEQALLATPVRREPPTEAELTALAAAENLPALVGGPEMRAADLVFLVLHGVQGEGGGVQALLELGRHRYTGSAPLGSAVAMDKEVTKRLLSASGVPTAPWALWPATAAEIGALGWPLIVKPSNGGSTVGLTVVREPEQLEGAIALACAHDRDVVLEAFLPGREFTVGVLGDAALAVGEIVPEHEIFDYECKYTPGMTREIFPAEIPLALAASLRALTLATHRALRLRDFSRVDFRLDGAGRPFVLEANTLPGMTATSLLPQSAAAVGMSFADLCAEICRLALSR